MNSCKRQLSARCPGILSESTVSGPTLIRGIMSFWDLFEWWNLIFTLPFCIGLIPLFLQIFGIARSGVHGHHLPHLHHGDVTHAPSGHHAPVSTHAAGHSADGKGHGIFSRLFSGMSLGDVPVMLTVSIFCFIWGASGMAANQIFSRILRPPALYIWPSLLCALFVTYVFSLGLTRTIARIMPQLESYGTEESLLVGRTARAAYAIDASPGSAFLLDDRQNRIQVRCRSHNGSVIASGAEVLLLEYDPKSRIFIAVPLEKELPAGNPPQMQMQMQMRKQNRIQNRS